MVARWSRPPRGRGTRLSLPVQLVVLQLRPSASILLEVAAAEVGRAERRRLVRLVAAVVGEVAFEVFRDTSPVAAPGK